MSGTNPQDNAEQGGGESPIPAITLPKGGGAVRGICEKLGANPVTGTANMTLPIFTPPDRAGGGPALSLSYDSGNGNGVFGLGWRLSPPHITRKTDKGLPRYQDAEESDVFLLSDADDLVPAKTQGALGWDIDSFFAPLDGVEHRVTRYRPRIESAFARIERWTRTSDGQTCWRTITKNNLTSWYGFTDKSRVADPDDATRTFTWLLDRSWDDRGNLTVYEYRAEDTVGVAPAPHEARRGADCNRHLKYVRYGNHTPYAGGALPSPGDFMFHVVLDYGDHDANAPGLDPDGTWLARPDPFSSYRAGFEIRTRRLCRRVLVFHQLTELGDGPCLVQSTDLGYQENPIASVLASATETHYLRDGQGYVRKSLPPIELAYSQAVVDQTPRAVELGENLPYGVDDRVYRWLDLDSEGAPGILTEQGGGWFYKRNVSNLARDSQGTVLATFESTEWVAPRPSLSLGTSRQFLDLSGEGKQSLVDFEQPTPGYFLRAAAGWDAFVPFAKIPNLDWRSPHLRHVDLDGDGLPDVLVSEDAVFTWYPSLGKDGFGPANQVSRPFDEDDGPALVLADPTGSIYLADMSGDGLSDLVRVRNGEICYWPNLGFGRFGAKVTMSNAPWFDEPDQFDPRRIRMADIDGSGTVDLIYLGRERVMLYFNQSGNGFSSGEALTELPVPDNLSSVTAVDLLGNGTACLVWSTPLPGADSPMTYVDLMGGQKPYLLISAKNNLGSETRVHYVASTRFYLQDRRDGRPWVTRLPFPVQVVDRIDMLDAIGRNRFTTRFAYHHGYFDGVEREFRGFGLVEQWDTDAHAALADDDTANLDQATLLPPVLTRTWFHTGAWRPEAGVSAQLAGEYWHEPGLTDDERAAMTLPDSPLPSTVDLPDGTSVPWTITAHEQREALRALKGRILRQETYVVDGTAQEPLPYTVSEHNYTVSLLQPAGDSRHAVFSTQPREVVDYHYERTLFPVGGAKLCDPRVTHAFTLAVDAWGNTLRSAAVSYGRRYDATEPLFTDADRATQKRTRVVVNENGYTLPIATADAYRGPLPCETRTYELINLAAGNRPRVTNFFQLAALAAQIALAGDGQHDLPYEDVEAAGAVTSAPYRRMVEHTRRRFLADDLAAQLAPGTMGSLALPYESYKLSLTPGLLAQFASKIAPADAAALLAGEGRLRDLDGDGNLWIPSGRTFFSPDPDQPDLAFAQAHFFLAQGATDPFGNHRFLTWDDHDLLPVKTRDALGNTIAAENDYRVLLPRVVTDANGNRTELAFDLYGAVAGTAVRGKLVEPDGVDKGDNLDGFIADPSDAVVATFLGDPLGQAAALLGNASTRVVHDPARFFASGLPCFFALVSRETHVSDLAPGQVSKVQVAFTFLDGRGREVQKKIQAEPGPLTAGGPDVALRWVGDGWTVLNNKDNPVQRYEPFFTASHDFEFAVMHGVSITQIYDPLSRVIATLHPDHTHEKIVFDPWSQTSWDRNDTCADDPAADPDIGAWVSKLAAADYAPTWLKLRTDPVLAAQRWPDPDERAAEATAASRTLQHASTPAVAWFDPMGRGFASIADNGSGDRRITRTEIDVEGNQRRVIDPLGRIVMTQDWDMLSTSIHQRGMDFGDRWVLHNAAKKPLRAWDDRGHQMRHVYDELLRPRQLWVKTGAGEALVEEVVYGEAYGASPADGAALNLLGRSYRQYDGAGLVTNNRYDWKGNLLEGSRQLVQDPTLPVNWNVPPALDPEIFSNSTRYDALNRPVQGIAPRSSLPGARIDVVQATYNEANYIERVDVWQQQAAVPGALLDPASATLRAVANVDYDAKGRRTLIEYAGGVSTSYTYDPDTFRLRRLTTLRSRDNVLLQDLRYTFDPAGNVTHVRDDADIQNVVYFKNQRVDPAVDYVYDALYQLASASGREHLGQTNNQPSPPQQVTESDGFRMALPQPGDGNAMGRYTENYAYDMVGNLLQMGHVAQSGSWTRRYAYSEPSAIEPGKFSNRLTATSLPGDANVFSAKYGPYDAHGNMGTMPQLSGMQWDFKDQLDQVDLGGGGTCLYRYDGAGQRVRKSWQKTATLLEERIYLNGWELFRRRNNGALEVERQTLHLMDGKRRIALIETTTVDTSASPGVLIRQQLGNHLDSALLELDENGDVISYEEYFPFGSTSYQSGRSLAEVSLKRYRHVGKERDDETGLYYYGARYYAPWLGRWTSCDPERLKDGPSAYVYTRNRPASLVDAAGRDSIPPMDAAYFADVVPPIVSVMKKKNLPTSKILFLLVQAYSEQGPGLGLPSDNDNRIFNHHMTDADIEAKFGKDKVQEINDRLKAGETIDFGNGVRVKMINQNESTDPAHPKMRASPTFIYDSLEASVEHHLTRLETEDRFKTAFAILRDPSGTIESYYRALRSFGHLLDDKQKKERAALEEAGKPITEERLMHYDEVILQKRLPQVQSRLQRWDMKELTAKASAAYGDVRVMLRELDEVKTKYAEVYEQFQKTGDFALADQLAALKAQQTSLESRIRETWQRAEAMTNAIVQIQAAIKGNQ